MVVSRTDHFTDMVNATVAVPGHEQTTSFNPTQLKDLQAGDPGNRVSLIEASVPDSTGDARLSYPIESGTFPASWVGPCEVIAL